MVTAQVCYRLKLEVQNEDSLMLLFLFYLLAYIA